MSPKYKMTISRLTVDKLGVKLYDKVSAVIAELVSNSYDADATKVLVKAPMGEMLANVEDGVLRDRDFFVEVTDNGAGMTPTEINKYYLRVGAERRKDERGDVSKRFGRKVMGRKGVGKLAPFGICQTIEIISAGGEKVTQGTETGYVTAHLILDRQKIMQDEDFEYEPVPGDKDGKISPESGTQIILKLFSRRRVPPMTDFSRQLAQRFGIRGADWKIVLLNNVTSSDPSEPPSVEVGEFSVETMENTRIEFKLGGKDNAQYLAYAPDGNIFPDIQAGFDREGKFYPVTGWVAYSKQPFRDDLMAGVRIYCRGKIAGQTSVFNQKAGFTGEHSVRSYLVGEIHADWLDEEEDLIQTDRRDILWSDERGQGFQEWGQAVVKKLGTLSRDPMKKKTWEQFQEIAEVDNRLDAAFPGEAQSEIKEQAKELTKILGQRVREDELKDKEHLDSLVTLCITIAPHIKLEEKLRQAADAASTPLAAVTEILVTARIAELSSFGMIASDRVKVIEHIQDLIDDASDDEAVFQNLIETAPWLVNPQWSPITMNQSLSTLKTRFEKYYKTETGKEISLTEFSKSRKRPDFVMTAFHGQIQIIEIKTPTHAMADADYERLRNYIEILDKFLGEPANAEFKQVFSSFKITLVCDSLNLGRLAKDSYDKFERDGIIERITWDVFLKRTVEMHQEYLDEAERQKTSGAQEER